MESARQLAFTVGRPIQYVSSQLHLGYLVSTKSLSLIIFITPLPGQTGITFSGCPNVVE